jgi:hypothetical protein
VEDAVSPACRKSIYRCTSGGKRLHVQIAAAALGRTLPRGAEVHHVNGDKWDNRHSNLVICQDRAYHALLHRNLRILRAGGDPFRDSHCSVIISHQLKGFTGERRLAPENRLAH